MAELLSDHNQGTQPLPSLRLFNNWDAVAKGWFVACKSSDVARGRAKSILLCGHRLVVFRGDSGNVHAMDAFCPHMGLDLGLGKVVGESVRCAFHGWRFAGDGACVEIPCLKDLPKKARLKSYAVEEQYGYIWVYPDSVAPEPVFVPDDLKGKPVAFRHMESLKRVVHPHVPMLNGIDAQHVMGVHGFSLVPEVQIREQSRNRMDVYLRTDIPAQTWIGKVCRFVLGPTYAYSNVFIDGTVALLNTVKDVRLFGRYKAPECNVVFSLRFTSRGQTEIIPIAVTEKRSGLLGRLKTDGILLLTKLGYDILKAQEGEEFFEGLRFRHDGLLPGYDGAIGALIAFTNRQELSAWSRTSVKSDENKNTEVEPHQGLEKSPSNLHGEIKCEISN